MESQVEVVIEISENVLLLNGKLRGGRESVRKK